MTGAQLWSGAQGQTVSVRSRDTLIDDLCELCATSRPCCFPDTSNLRMRALHRCSTRFQCLVSVRSVFGCGSGFRRPPASTLQDCCPNHYTCSSANSPSGEARSKTQKRSGETPSLTTLAGRPKLRSHEAGRLFPRPWGMSRDRKSLLLFKHGLRLTNQSLPVPGHELVVSLAAVPRRSVLQPGAIFISTPLLDMSLHIISRSLPCRTSVSHLFVEQPYTCSDQVGALDRRVRHVHLVRSAIT